MTTATDSSPTQRNLAGGTSRGLPALPSLEEKAPRGLGLGARMFLGAAALLAATLGTAVLIASRGAERIAERKIVEDLKAVPAIFAGYMDSQAAARRGQVRSLAEAPGTKALLADASGDPGTLHDTALEFGKGLAAGIVFLFDANGALVTRSDREPGEEAGRDFMPVSWVATPITQLEGASAFILDVRGSRSLHLVASAPVVQGAGSELALNGVLAAAFPMDNDRARELAGMTSGEVAFLANLAPRDATPKLEAVASTERLAQASLARRLPDSGGLADRLFRRGEAHGPLAFEIDGEPYIGTALPIRSGGGEPIAALLVARSQAAELATFRQIRRTLFAVGGAVLLVALPLSFLLSQGLARPIRQLARSAEEVGRGQLDVALPQPGGGEVGALARAFGMMVGELRAKAQLEALLSEMQRRPGDQTFRGRLPPGDAESGSLAPGALFAGRYEILSALGEGGMGTVFRARDRELDDEVALKVLKPAPEGASPTEILRQEIKLARMITHVNVVRVHDFGESDSQLFLTMEYVPGTTLRELLDGRRGMELTPALQIAKQICRGLTAVHKAGIVHGDLKPQNVMVMSNGVVKLMDFGVARAGAAGGISSAAPIAGTPIYMSPEQARGAELDERSDLYSSGVVLFELFTGRPPFRDGDALEIMRMHLNEPPPNPRSLRPDLPESLSNIMLACLHKSRLRRPANAADLERLLMRVRP
jgi:HAMP domain-containing protein/predicted Ser/Thr protein kinase